MSDYDYECGDCGEETNMDDQCDGCGSEDLHEVESEE